MTYLISLVSFDSSETLTDVHFIKEVIYNLSYFIISSFCQRDFFVGIFYIHVKIKISNGVQ